MTAETHQNLELEALRGATTLEAARYVVDRLPGIAHVQLRVYQYSPDTTYFEEPTYQVDRDAFLYGNPVDDLVRDLPLEANVALDSPVWLSHQEPDEPPAAHFGMMDLHVAPDPKAIEFIREQLAKAITPQFGKGILLQTRRSYHYLGTQLVPQEDCYRFLAEWLLAEKVTKVHEGLPRVHTPVADTRYVGHVLKRAGITGLRLTTRGTKKTHPTVVDFI